MRLTATGPVSPDEVWDRYVRPHRWPEWSPQIRGVDYPTARLRAGTRGRVHGPLGATADFEVLAVDDQHRRWSWRVRVGPIELTLTHDVAAHDAGTRTGLDIEAFPPITWAYAPLAQFALQRLVSRPIRPSAAR